jgi:hypothetical protein
MRLKIFSAAVAGCAGPRRPSASQIPDTKTIKEQKI